MRRHPAIGLVRSRAERFARRLTGRYRAVPGRPWRAVTVLLRRAAEPRVAVRLEHHRHQHLHRYPVLHRHDRSAPMVVREIGLRVVGPLRTAPPVMVRLRPEPPAPPVVTGPPPRPSPAAGSVLPGPILLPRPAPAGTAKMITQRRLPQPSSGPRTPPRFGARPAPVTTRETVVVRRVAGPAAQPAAPAHPPTIPPPVRSADGPAVRPATLPDLDAVTAEVLRRIERRAVAQRERLGRG